MRLSGIEIEVGGLSEKLPQCRHLSYLISLRMRQARIEHQVGPNTVLNASYIATSSHRRQQRTTTIQLSLAFCSHGPSSATDHELYFCA